jgi:hypothetical protein
LHGSIITKIDAPRLTNPYSRVTRYLTIFLLRKLYGVGKNGERGDRGLFDASPERKQVKKIGII